MKIKADTAVTTASEHNFYAYRTKCDHSNENWVSGSCSLLNEEKHTHICADCGETVEEDHQYDDRWLSEGENGWGSHVWQLVNTITPQTCSEDGLGDYVCEDCGYEIGTEVIPAAGEPGNIEYPSSLTTDNSSSDLLFYIDQGIPYLM